MTGCEGPRSLAGQTEPMKPLALDRWTLERLAGTPLFYPCSGDDLRAPIDLFAPAIRDFWFVDIGYFVHGRSAHRARRVLAADQRYMLRSVEVTGPETPEMEVRADERTGKAYEWLEPGGLTERYLHWTSDQLVSVHRRRGFGPSALRKEIGNLGVFFYRGDSLGEGGSGTLWLSVHHSNVHLIEEVLAKLVDGGLIVTDGSNCHGSQNPYAELGRFHRQAIGREAVRLARPFADPQGRRFECIGYVCIIIESEPRRSKSLHRK
jgi:hypothetical protein